MQQYFTNNVLNELLIKTKWIKNVFDDEYGNKDKSKLWRCNSCDQLLGYEIKRITLTTGTKVWEINVENIGSDHPR